MSNFTYIEIVAAPDPIARMYYRDFETQVTKRTRVVREHWPVDTFCSPHTMAVPELRILYRVLISEDAPLLFRKLTEVEYEAHRKTLAAQSTAAQPPSPNPLGGDGVAGPSSEQPTSPQDNNTGGSPRGIPPQGNAASDVPPHLGPVEGQNDRQERWDSGLTLAEKAIVKKQREAEKEAARKQKAAEREAKRLGKQAQRRSHNKGKGKARA